MPVVQIEQEAFDALSEDMKKALKEYTPVDVTGLTNTANTLLSEKEAEKARADALAAEVASLKATKTVTKTEADPRLEDALAQLQASKAELNTFKATLELSKVEAEAKRIAASINPTDARKQALLVKEILPRLQHDSGNFTVLSTEGKATISSLDDLTNEIKTNLDFLAAGSQASGGSALGGAGTPVVKSFADMTATEKVKLANTNPEQYLKLKGAK